MSLSTVSSGSTRKPAARPRLMVIALAGLVGLAIGAIVSLVGYDPPIADNKYDWLVARESVRDGGDAYRDLLLIARDEGVEIAVSAGPGTEQLTGHPRSPGAILLQLPLILVPFDALYAFSIFLTLLAFGFVAASFDLEKLPRLGLLAIVVGLATAPLFVTLRYTGQAAFVAALTLTGWRLTQEHKEYSGGLLIGLAAVVKIFPAILIVPLLLRRRWRSSLVVVATGVIVNLLGLALPGVSFSRALDELSRATGTWVGLAANGSLVRRLSDTGMSPLSAQAIAVGAVACLLVITAAVTRRRHSTTFPANPFVWLSAGLLIVPLSWIGYDLALFPAVLIAADNRRTRRFGLFCLGLWAVPVLLWPIVVIPNGDLATVVRITVCVLAIAAAGAFRTWELGEDPPHRRQVGLQRRATVVDQLQS